MHCGCYRSSSCPWLVRVTRAGLLAWSPAPSMSYACSSRRSAASRSRSPMRRPRCSASRTRRASSLGVNRVARTVVRRSRSRLFVISGPLSVGLGRSDSDIGWSVNNPDSGQESLARQASAARSPTAVVSHGDMPTPACAAPHRPRARFSTRPQPVDVSAAREPCRVATSAARLQRPRVRSATSAP